MKKRTLKRFTTIIIIFCFHTFALYAQESSDSISIEELYLQQGAELLRIKKLAFSSEASSNMKLEALESLSFMLENDSISEENLSVHEIINRLAGEGTTCPFFDKNGFLVNDFPLVRIEACKLAGKFGGSAQTETLMSVIRSDHDYFVIKEAINSLCSKGSITDFSRNLFNRIHYEVIGREPDSHIIFTCLDGIEQLMEQDILLNTQEIYTELILFIDPRNAFSQYPAYYSDLLSKNNSEYYIQKYGSLMEPLKQKAKKIVDILTA